MKRVLLILDGATDEPLPELEQRTPLMAARLPRLAALVERGNVGAAQLLPPGWEADPEAALLGCFGYSPAAWWTGRGPLEAAALDVDVERGDLAFRLNLVSTDGERLLDATAGRVSEAAAEPLLRAAAERLRGRFLHLYPGRGHRHLLVWRQAPEEIRCTDPRLALGEPLRPHYPRGERAERLHQLIEDSHELLSRHPVNRRREDEGKPPANLLWPWGPGGATRLPGFGFQRGLGGALVAGHPLARGIGRLAGLYVPDLPGATGSVDTDTSLKARAALRLLREYDFVAIHLAAPHEAAREGDFEAKVDALQAADERLLGPLGEEIGKLDDFRLLVAVDHPTPCAARRAAPGAVPFLLTGSRERPRSPRLPFDERAVDEAAWRVEEPERFLEPLLAAAADAARSDRPDRA